jgi:hypothetical protein
MGGVTLMAKAVAVADLWCFRTGQGHDLSLDVRLVPHRLRPFYDGEWESLNGYRVVTPPKGFRIEM